MKFFLLMLQRGTVATRATRAGQLSRLHWDPVVEPPEVRRFRSSAERMGNEEEVLRPRPQISLQIECGFRRRNCVSLKWS